MSGNNNFPAQIEALKRVLDEHSEARLTITGGEPGLYPNHIANVVETYHNNSKNIFCSINTSGFSTELNGLAHINLSCNNFVKPNPEDFPNCTVQTVMGQPTLDCIKEYMKINANGFSFRFLSGFEKKDYPVYIWNDLQNDSEINVHTFRIGDFFVYATFDYNGKHARITLGDMWQQRHNDYQDGYSNIIIHPDGRVATNWR
jgi:MoaA/NifB/PqqE/SkfB family radical SAM enzyme